MQKIQTIYRVTHKTLYRAVDFVINLHGQVKIEIENPGLLSIPEMIAFLSWIIKELHTLQKKIEEEQVSQEIQQASRVIPPKGPVGGRGTHNIG